MSSVEYSHQSPHSQEALWRLFGNFTDLSWLPGPDKVTEGEHEGKTARLIHMGDLPPLVEYLLEKDDATCTLRYSVIKHDLIPVDDYTAQLSIAAAGEGATVTFKSTFTPGDTGEAEAKQMLAGAYQMMTEAADQRLAANP